MFFFNWRCLSVKGGRRQQESRVAIFVSVDFRVYWGWNCFIARWRMVCLLGSSEQHYPWTVGDALVPWEWEMGWFHCWQHSASHCSAGRGSALGRVGFGQCQKAPERVLGDPNSRDQLMEKGLYVLVNKCSLPIALLLSVRFLGVPWIQCKWSAQMGVFCSPGVTVAGIGHLYRTGLYIQSCFLQVRAGEKTAMMYCRITEIWVVSVLQNVLKIVSIFLSQKWEIVFHSNIVHEKWRDTVFFRRGDETPETLVLLWQYGPTADKYLGQLGLFGPWRKVLNTLIMS